MGKSRDSQRAAAVSAVNGSPRRRQRVTAIRDSSDDDEQMELKETLRLIDRGRLRKKDRRRSVDSRRIVQSSDEEDFEEDGETRTNQPPPGNSSLSKNRRAFRSATRSSAVVGTNLDEAIGMSIPRRARSAKRLREYRNSGTSSGTGEDLRQRKSTLSPGMGSPIGSDGTSLTSSGVSMKKKKCVASNSKSPSLIQDDLEIEVAEALFDLMKQSHSQPQSSDRDGKVYRDGTNTVDDGELKRLQSGLGKVDNAVFKVQSKESVNADTDIILDNNGGENDKLRDEPNQESLSGDGFADRGKARFPKEGESSPRVIRNACDIQDPTVTKEGYASIVVEDNKKKAPMELPSLLSTSDVQKKGETPNIGVIDRYRATILSLEKKTRHDDISTVGGSSSQQPRGRKEKNIQSSTSLPFPIGMGSRTSVLPRPGYTSSVGTGSPNIMMPPQYKPVESRTRRCTTHKYIADNIYHHQQLLAKSLLSSSRPTTGGSVTTLYGTNPKRPPTGKDKNSNVNTCADVAGRPPHQQVSNQSPALNLAKSGFSIARRQNTMMGPRNFPANSSSSFLEGSSFNQQQQQHRQFFPSNMGILQSGIPAPTNTNTNTSLPSFNIPQIRRQPIQRGRAPPNMGSSKLLADENINIGNNNRVELGPPQHHLPLAYGSSMSNNQSIFQMVPEGKSHTDPFLANFYRHQQQQQQQQQLLRVGGASSSSGQTGYSSFLSRSREGLFHHPRMMSYQEQNLRNMTQPSLIVGEGSNAPTGSSRDGESNPACRRVVLSILSTGANQVSDMREG